MKNICKFLNTNNKSTFCKMKGSEIDNDTYSVFCTKNNLAACPVYQYYLQKYKELTSK